MHRAFLLLGTLLLLLCLASGCGPYPPPTRPAASARELPPVLPDKALVIFMFPPCARYSGPAATDEEKLLCRKRRRNRIRIVESDGRLVTDFGVDQYGASYEEPGRHVYGAYHHFDHCTWDRTDCVAALKANLVAGRVYIVTFRWSYTLTSGGKSLGLVYGRLEVTPVSPEREAIFRERLSQVDRVEIIPGAERGRFGELRSTYVSGNTLGRLVQDREDGVPTPHLGGRVTVEELPVPKEEPKKEEPKEEETVSPPSTAAPR